MSMIRKKTFPGVVRWRWLRRGLIGVLALIALPAILVLYVHWTTGKFRFSDPRQVPSKSVAIVFGAEVRPNGQLSPMLAARVRQAAESYRAGRVQKILMTGDNSRTDYDEVTAMQRYAIELGVPADVIRLDYAGFSTYESCYRARDIFGIRDAIVITQGFHLPRAVYTCAHFGIDTVGLETDDRGSYSARTMRRHGVREILATAKALWDVHLWHPLPTFLGKYEGLE
jgi:vancomycin permeability regulator SanA